MWADRFKKYWDLNKRVIIIVTSVVLGLAFVGSLLAAILGGGELIEKVEKTKLKGMLKLQNISYETEYMTGDTFEFDKGEEGKVFLYVKDPDLKEPVKDDNLPDDQYGFMVNGEGEIISDPSSIVLDSSVTSIDVVSVKYPTVKTTIPVTVLGTINSGSLVNALTLEAEEANLYRDGTLLTEEEMQTSPNTDKPYISSYGDTIAGESCSMGACLRNFQSSEMKIEFKFVCLEETEVQLEIMICSRTTAKNFGDSYLAKINGVELESVNSVSIPKGNTFFDPYTMKAVTIKLKRGLNTITFESGAKIGRENPHNFDAIKITAADNVIGDMDCVSG